jgi:hypothetical protein
MGAPIVGTVEPERFRTPSVRKRLPYVRHSCAKTRRYENPSAKPHPFLYFFEDTGKHFQAIGDKMGDLDNLQEKTVVFG